MSKNRPIKEAIDFEGGKLAIKHFEAMNKTLTIEIPEGWELSVEPDTFAEILKNNNNATCAFIGININKVEEKTFLNYVALYSDKVIMTLSKDGIRNYLNLYKGNFDEVPFEIKIGLLKFICGSIGASWTLFISYTKHPLYLSPDRQGEILKVMEVQRVLSKNFMKSLFK